MVPTPNGDTDHHGHRERDSDTNCHRNRDGYSNRDCHQHRPTSTPTPVAGKLKVSPKTLKFGTVTVNDAVLKMVTVSNADKTTKKSHPLPILIEMENASGMPTPSPFSVTTQCSNDDLMPKGKGVPKNETSCEVAVQFKPTQAVAYTGTLTIRDNLEPSEMQTVQMTGKGKATK